jgi:hypothetical protein
MRDAGVQLARREQQIVDLLLQGCDNAEISKQLNMAKRTVKAHFNRLFLRYGISSGIKRVKLATFLYRRQLCLQTSGMEHASQASGSIASSNLLPKDSKIATSQTPSEPPSTSLKTICAQSTTSLDSGIESNLPSGMRHEDTNRSHELDEPEAWEHSILGLSEHSSGTHN